MRRLIVAVTLMTLAAGACTQDDPAVEANAATPAAPTTQSPATTTTTAPADPTTTMAPGTTTTTTIVERPVDVAEDLTYSTDDSGPSKVDVYFSTVTEGGPVVVLFPGAGVSKTFGTYGKELAPAIAERGGVVFVPNWLTLDIDEITADIDRAACAAAYALAHAAEYGADPDTLILSGHSAGAQAAAMVGLREVAPVDDCSVEMVPVEADGLVLWEGDWMLGPAFVQYGERLPDLLEQLAPWTLLATAPRMPVSFVTTAGAVREYHMCDVSDPDSPFWVRDPDGWFRERFEARGALDDDCVDVGEPAELLAETMREHGFDVTELFLNDSGHLSFGSEDLETVVDEIMTVADR